MMKRANVLRLVMLGTLSAARCLAPAADNPTPPAASSAAAAPAPEVQIPFAKNNLWNWQVLDDQTLLIQDRSRRWYKATLFGHCINLPFANRIAFDSNPSGTFDKFSAILVRGQRCPLMSLVATTAPAKKSQAKKPEPAPAPQ